MRPSLKCYDLIKSFEGCRLTAYKDPGSLDGTGLPITIGFGSTMKKDGTRFKLGDNITMEQAEDLLRWEINNKAAVVDGLTSKCVLNQNMFDALVSLVFNIGAGNFANSTLLKKLRISPTDPTIPDEFLRWNKANKKVMLGLTRRRAAEAKVYTEPIMQD